MIPNLLGKRINEKLALLQKRRPLSAAAVAKLNEQFSIALTYNSNAIEGNKLTLKETYLVVNDGITVKGKSFKDHLEAKNHLEAVHYLEELIDSKRRVTISESLIRSLQKLVVQNIEDHGAGKYRQGRVLITGAKHQPAEAYQVPALMEDFIAWIHTESQRLHPAELAAIAHHRLVYIHPFDDGNGRTARLLMNLILMRSGYPIVVILKNDRSKYYRVLDQADRGHYLDLCKFVAQAVERSLNIYLKALPEDSMITVKSDQQSALVPLSELAKHSRFSEKYLNLLARSGKLDAHKEGRKWLSSRQALKRYLETRERKRN
jgi:Fic family protein